jgi:hypothetical protein
MRATTVTLVGLAMLAMLVGGCTKKVELTIVNHSEISRTIQVTGPEETMTLGQVGPNGGSLTATIAVKASDLPAQLHMSAGAGASTSFAVTEDSPDRWWFHITNTGTLAGPYGRKDVHVETTEEATVEVKSEPRMIVK